MQTKLDFLERMTVQRLLNSAVISLYLDRDFVGQAVLRLAVAVLRFPALLVSFFRFSADAECCVP